MVHIVLLGGWMGAYAELIVLSGSVGSVVASRHEAGAVLLAALSDLERHAVWVVPILLITLWTGWSEPGRKRRGRTGWLLGLAGLTLASRYVIAPRFKEIRDGLGRPVEDLGLADPALVDYLWWERLLSLGVVAQAGLALVLLVWAVVQHRSRPSMGISL